MFDYMPIAMTIEERRKRAIEWLEAIYEDYFIAAHNYRVFWEVNKMFDNPKLKVLDNTFHAPFSANRRKRK